MTTTTAIQPFDILCFKTNESYLCQQQQQQQQLLGITSNAFEALRFLVKAVDSNSIHLLQCGTGRVLQFNADLQQVQLTDDPAATMQIFAFSFSSSSRPCYNDNVGIMQNGAFMGISWQHQPAPRVGCAPYGCIWQMQCLGQALEPVPAPLQAGDRFRILHTPTQRYVQQQPSGDGLQLGIDYRQALVLRVRQRVNDQMLHLDHVNLSPDPSDITTAADQMRVQPSESMGGFLGCYAGQGAAFTGGHSSLVLVSNYQYWNVGGASNNNNNIVTGSTTQAPMVWHLERVSDDDGDDNPRQGRRYPLVIAGQSNSLGANGQGIADSAAGGGGGGQHYQYRDLQWQLMSLPEPGALSVQELRAAGSDPRIRQLYQQNTIIMAGVLFESGFETATTCPHYQRGVPPAIGDEMQAAFPLQGGRAAWLSQHAASWPLFAARHLMRRLRPQDEVWLIGNGVGDSGFHTNQLQQTWLAHAENNLADEARQRITSACLRYQLQPAVALMWHQGEHDVGAGMPGSQYQQHLIELMQNMRQQTWAAATMPVVVGQMGPLLRSVLDSSIHHIHLAMPSLLANAATAQNQDTYDQHIGDHVHLTGSAHRSMGDRYAEALLGLQHSLRLL
jgi:hypothetical protein